MARKTSRLLLVAALTAAPLAAAPSTIPATLKTLESILGSLELPASDAGRGVQPLHSAVAAADALLSSLDPHGDSGASLEAPEGDEEREGCGILLGRIHGYPAVTGVVPDSAAFYGPVREGDRILAVNDVPVPADWALPRVERLLRGKPGEKVEIRVLHPGEHTTAVVEFEFGDARPRVEARLLPGGVAYVTLSGPTALVLAEYKLAVAKLLGDELIGVVLDLRGAQQGSTEDAVALADPFLEERVVATRVAASGSDRTYKTGPDRVTTVPLVVLVSAGTRGAAELAAAALQANRRALVLGAPTQGRALEYRQVQRSGVHLTLPAALHRAPGGKLLTGRGLVPDIEVEPVPFPRNQARWFGEQRLAFAKGVKWEPKEDESETEKDLQAVLQEEEGDDEDHPAQVEPDEEDLTKTAEEAAAPSDPFHDYPLVKRYDPRLVRAIHLLKAASIFFQSTRTSN